MSLFSLAPNRTILMISDEALYIYSTGAKGIEMVEAVPWSAENFEDNVALIISKDCGGKPILLLNDMVEQHYKKEKIPRVSAMDKQNVLKRKLKVAFPNYPVHAALQLKQKIEKSDKSMAASVYLLAAVPATEPFRKTMLAAKRSLATIVGFCLLPIESSDMLKKLALKVQAKSENKPKWTVFIGFHQSGGLRQVVIKDGELALTRMTPISESDENPVAWANEVHQEFKATMSYLSRFGFDSDDGLNVIFVSDPSTGNILNELIQVECNFYSFTVDEAAELLNLKIGDHQTDSYADILHVAWIGRKSKFILPMKAKQIENVSKPRQMAAAAIVLLFLAGLVQSYYLLDVAQKLTENLGDKETAQLQYSQLDLQYKKEVERKKDMGFDIELIQGSLSVYDALEAKQIKILPLLYNVGEALGRSMRIDRIDVERKHSQPSSNSRNNAQQVVSPLFISRVLMTFPSNSDVKKGNMEVEQLRERLQRALPDHTVSVLKFLEDYEYSEEIVVESGAGKKELSSQDYVAELSIEGPSAK